MALSKKKANKVLGIFWTVVIGSILLVFLLFLSLSAGWLGYMPSFEELENPKSNLATQVLSSDGRELGSFAVENRTFASYDQISPYITSALIATEDERFRSHSGIDARGLMRVVGKTVIMQDQSSGGGSTISQQLAKLMFHERPSSLLKRAFQKLNEWVIAVKLEKSYTKNEIISMYLNKVGFIYDAYGITSATRTFFNEEPNAVKIEEAATIVGMLKNPALFNPVRRPEITQKRRNVVLGQMLRSDLITPEECDSLQNLPLKLKFKRNDHKEGVAPYLRENIRLMLTASKPERENYSEWAYDTYRIDSTEWENNPAYGFINKRLKSDGTKYNIYRDGIKIYTTVDYNMQVAAENAVKEHLSEFLQPAFFREKSGRRKAPFSNSLSDEDYEKIMNRAVKQSERYRLMRNAKIPLDTIMLAFNTPTSMDVFSWHGDIDTTMTPMDSIKYTKSFLRASLYSVNPHNGHVKAYVGGPNFKYFMYDMATKGKRQVGSTIKPYLYTLAMQEGFTPCTKVPNIPQTFILPDGKTWTPRNSGSRKAGEMVTLKWGLATSNNNISAWVMKQFNPEAVKHMIHELGIKSDMPAVPSLCLGIPDFSLSEMVSAYGTYANKGVNIEPIMITRIEDKYGNIIDQYNPKKKEVISEQTAYLMLNLIQGVVNYGTGIRLRYKYKFTGQIGGKTGTTQNNSDGWFMGVTPNLVTGVWVGGEDRDIHFDNMAYGQGASMALPIWALYMKDVYADENNNVSEDDVFDEPNNFSLTLDCDEPSTNEEGEVSNEQQTSNESEFF